MIVSVDSAISSSRSFGSPSVNQQPRTPLSCPSTFGGGPWVVSLGQPPFPLAALTSLRSSFLKSVHQIQTSNHSLSPANLASLSFPLCKRVSLDFHPSHPSTHSDGKPRTSNQHPGERAHTPHRIVTFVPQKSLYHQPPKKKATFFFIKMAESNKYADALAPTANDIE